ncbi:MBL fold metallo-hydrolase [Roseivirga sp.]|uniref:MBL fold metallo-hydrolase n=1 Tax=Roseivirga sp. TaxID=1964215 RepID=UPI003B52E700
MSRSHHLFSILTILGIITLTNSANAQKQTNEIIYLANEGLMISSGDKQILIDALFDDFYEDYLSPDEATINQMNHGEKPFESVEAVLVTHIHRDHFEANIAGKFLSMHEESKLLSSQQTEGELKEKFDGYAKIKGQIIAVEKNTITTRHEVNGITVYGFFINHAGGERMSSIHNMAFLIEVNGKRLLHVGDSDMDVERFRSLNLSQYNIDVALIPYWYLSDATGQQIVRDLIQADQHIGIHFPKAPSAMALEEIEKQFPEATVFQTPRQKVGF